MWPVRILYLRNTQRLLAGLGLIMSRPLTAFSCLPRIGLLLLYLARGPREGSRAVDKEVWWGSGSQEMDGSSVAVHYGLDRELLSLNEALLVEDCRLI